MGLVGEDAEPIVLRVEIRKSNHPNSALSVSSVSLEKEDYTLYPKPYTLYQCESKCEGECDEKHYTLYPKPYTLYPLLPIYLLNLHKHISGLRY